MLHLAFSATDSYVDYLGTALLSLIKHHPDQEITCYVLSSWLSDHSRFKLSQLESEHVSIQVIEVDKEQFAGLPLKANISLETYYRLLLAELLPDLDRVLYLDCDVLVTGSLLPLWTTDLTGYYAAGVNERDMLHWNVDYRRSLGFADQDIYINAGVTLFHLAEMRRDGMTQRLFAVAEEVKDKITHQDQDILNLTFKGRIKHFPAIYNYTAYEREVNELPLSEVALIHYNWHKPWVHGQAVVQYNYPTFALYQIAHETYRQQVEPMLTVLVSSLGSRPDAVRTCLDSLLAQTYRNLDVVVLVASRDMAELAQAYALTDSRLRLLEVSDHSLPDAYRAGLETAYGDWLALVDSEDWLDAHYLANLYRTAQENQADLAVTSFTLYNEETGVYSLFEPDISAGQVRSGQALVERFAGLKWFEQYRHLSLVGKLYHRSVVDRAGQLMRFTQANFWALSLLLVANRVAFAPDRQYVKRLTKVEEQPVWTAEGLQLARQELKELLLSCSFLSCDLTHLRTYYARLLADYQDQAHGLGKVDQQAGRDLMAYRALERLLDSDQLSAR